MGKGVGLDDLVEGCGPTKLFSFWKQGSVLSDTQPGSSSLVPSYIKPLGPFSSEWIQKYRPPRPLPHQNP